jgi:hypothetical protein
VLQLTLDTSSVIHGTQAQPYGPQIDELVQLRPGRPGRPVDHYGVRQRPGTRANGQAPAQPGVAAGTAIHRTIRGAFRLGYSRLGIDTVLLSEEQKAVAMTIDEILLPKAYRVGNLRADDEALMVKWRRKANDAQHLVAHLIAGHDATSDDADMLKKRAELLARTGIVVIDPTEAVRIARQQP